jgi:peptidoglycan hydrolase-like protein with peptidoglycan-binding domain
MSAPSKIAGKMKIAFGVLVIGLAAAASLLADQSIADVQRALKDQGFYYGEVNGQKDADTSAAIRRYQIRNGLQITGELNDETLRSIKSTANSAAQSPPTIARSGSPSVPATPDPSDLRSDSTPQGRPITPAPVERVPPLGPDQWQQRPNVGRQIPSGNGMFSGTPYETAPVEIQRKVIADAQRILARRGLFRDEIDGAYGPNLEFSLRAYQSRVGLAATGQLDLETLAALQLLPGVHTPVFTPRRPVVAPEPAVRGEWVRP